MENKIEFCIAIALYWSETGQLAGDICYEEMREKGYAWYELYRNSNHYYIDEFIEAEKPNINMF